MLTIKTINYSLLGLAVVIKTANASHGQPLQTEPPPWVTEGHVLITENTADNNNISINTPLTINVKSNATLSLGGELSSYLFAQNAIIKHGQGQLNISGENNFYNSNTLIQQGSIQVSGHTPLGPYYNVLGLHKNTTLKLEPNTILSNTIYLYGNSPESNPTPQDNEIIKLEVAEGTATFNGHIQPTQPSVIHKTGKGILHFTGEMPYVNEASLSVQEGEVRIDGHFWSLVTAQPDSKISGAGYINNLQINSGAIFSPYGTMTIQNQLQFEPGSKYVIRAWANGISDSTVVYGNTVLAGQVVAMPQGNEQEWGATNNYVIVSSVEGFNNTEFDSAVSAVPYLTAKMSYEADKAILTLEPYHAEVVEPEQPIKPSESKPEKNNSATQEPPFKKPNTVTATPQTWPANIRSIMLEDSRFIREAVYENAMDNQPSWVHAWHSNKEKQIDRRISGLISGIHYERNNVSIGFAAGISKSFIQGSLITNTATANSTHMAIYAASKAKTWGINAGAAYSHHRVKADNLAQTSLLSHMANSNYSAQTIQTFARASFNLWNNELSSLKPYIDVAWVKHKTPAITETGGPLAMHYTKAKASAFFSTVGIQGSHDIYTAYGNATVFADIGIRHMHSNRNINVRQHYEMDGLKTALKANPKVLERTATNLTLGVKANVGKRSHASLAYRGLHSKSSKDHGFLIGLNIHY